MKIYGCVYFLLFVYFSDLTATILNSTKIKSMQKYQDIQYVWVVTVELEFLVVLHWLTYKNFRGKILLGIKQFQRE